MLDYKATNSNKVRWSIDGHSGKRSAVQSNAFVWYLERNTFQILSELSLSWRATDQWFAFNDWVIFLKRYDNFLTAIVMQSCASNNGSLSKDAPYLNALPTRNFKCQFDSRYLTSIYKVKTGSVKKNVKLLFPVANFFKACLAYLKIAFHFVSGTFSPPKKPIFSQFSNAER